MTEADLEREASRLLQEASDLSRRSKITRELISCGECIDSETGAESQLDHLLIIASVTALWLKANIVSTMAFVVTSCVLIL